jgi:hypothetical protein
MSPSSRDRESAFHLQQMRYDSTLPAYVHESPGHLALKRRGIDGCGRISPIFGGVATGREDSRCFTDGTDGRIEQVFVR